MPKIPSIPLKTQLFIGKLKKETVSRLSNANYPNFSEITFSVGHLHKVGSLSSSLQAIDELVCFKYTEMSVILIPEIQILSFQIEVLRSLGWDLIMLAGQ
jgi:hypothetical protein